MIAWGRWGWKLETHCSWSDECIIGALVCVRKKQESKPSYLRINTPFRVDSTLVPYKQSIWIPWEFVKKSGIAAIAFGLQYLSFKQWFSNWGVFQLVSLIRGLWLLLLKGQQHSFLKVSHSFLHSVTVQGHKGLLSLLPAAASWRFRELPTSIHSTPHALEILKIITAYAKPEVVW